MQTSPGRIPANVPCRVPNSLTISACAKINLCLAVGPPEPADSSKPGFHRIASWFAAIDLCDEIELSRAQAGAGSCRIVWADDAPKPSPIDWAIETDLGVRAHRLLEHAVGRSLPVDMVIRKRIPVGGGLGGGSSDAAGVLVGLAALFDLPIRPSELRDLSARLGSDIAFFIDERPADVRDGGRIVLAPRPALVTGFGETLERLNPPTPAPGTHVLLFIPEFGCPTGAVYRSFDARTHALLDEPRVRTLIARSCSTGAIASSELFNDLAEPACDVQPQLAAELQRLRKAFGDTTPIHVTGSGSTMFALAAPSLIKRAREANVRAVACRVL